MQHLSQQLLIHELAELAQVSIRTIRYYIAEGLLPTPETRGKYTSYSQDYVDRIRLIQRLKDAYLPLREIRALVENIPFEDTHLLLDRTRYLSPEDFIKEIRALSQPNRPQREIRDDVVNYAARMLPPASAPVSPRQNVRERNLEDRRVNQPAPDEEDLEFPPIQKNSMEMGISFGRENLNQLQGRLAQVEEIQYYRVEIIPGLEIHIDHVAYARFAHQIDRVIEYAKRLFT